jgi:hypothetical protein
VATTIEPRRRAGAGTAPARAAGRPPSPNGHRPPRRPIIQARSYTSDGSRPLSAAGVVIVGIIVYAVTALLNSNALVERSIGQRDNAFRGVSQDVADNLDQVADWLYLDEPSQWAQEVRAGDDGSAPAADAEEAFGALDAATSTTVPPADPNAAAPPAAGTATATTVPTAPTVPPGQPVLRVPTDADPLRVYAAGDSLVGGWGEALVNQAGNSNGIEVDLDFEVSTGLVRTDFYNWPGRLQTKIEELNPEVVVLGFGGNDAQPMNVGGTSVDVLDPRWQAEYRERVGAVMDFINQGGRKLIWVGTPNHPEPDLTAKFAVMNQIFKEEAAARSNITFIDTWARFASPDGGYAPFIPNEQGEFIDVRAGDGFHLNFDGVNILAGMILGEVQTAVQTYSQPAATPAGATPASTPGG